MNYYLPKTLAEMKLPGLPATERGIQIRSQKEGWHFRERTGRGGGREYHINSLPESARAELARREAIKAAKQARPLTEALAPNTGRQAVVHERALIDFQKLPATAQRRAEAREMILRAFEQYHKNLGTKLTASRLAFCQTYNEGADVLPAWVREEVGSLSVPSLSRWQRTLKIKGIAALAGEYGNRKGCTKIDENPAAKETMLGMIVDHPHASAKHIMRALRARFSEDEIPSYRTVQRWVADWKADNKQVHLALRDPDRWRGKYMAANGSRSEHVFALNQFWEFDSTPADLLLADGKRHNIVGVIDVYSRRLKLHVSRTSSSAAVAALTRRAILDWGVPEIAKTDNGADYVSKHMRRIFEQLGIEQQLCTPFQPQEKPHIERAFRTFSHDLLELLPGFVGHNVADRKAIEARKSFAARLMGREESIEMKITPEELQDFCNSWTENVYAHDVHGSLKGKTPWQMAQEWTGELRGIENERSLDILLAPAAGSDGLRVVTKKGIKLDGMEYFAAELAVHIGDQVFVKIDEADLGRIYIFTLEHEFICIAECPELTGISREEKANKVKALQAAYIAEEKRALKQVARNASTKDIAHEILKDRARAAGKLVEMPRPRATHQTSALNEAAKALIADQPPTAPQMDDSFKNLHAKLEAELAPRPERVTPAAVEKVTPLPESSRHRFAKALSLRERLSTGRPISNEDSYWLGAYEQTTEYKVEAKLMKEFGPDYLSGY